MKTSVCITVLNEEKSISSLIDSLLIQSKKPDEIVIVDGGSNDKTVELIRHYQKKDKKIKLIIEKCNRAEGRNISIDMAKNEIIATTDADCIADKFWLEKLTEPFKHEEIDISAGFYNMITNNNFQKAESFFLGVLPCNFDESFLPSTRSMAFRKKTWELIGGFPEREDNSSEDTDFNQKALNLGLRYSRVKDARVEWRIPDTYKGFIKKIYSYAKWDAKYGIWWDPKKRFMSHNMKSLFKLIRYIIGFIILFIALSNKFLWCVVLILMLMYLYWSFKKVYSVFKKVNIGFWGIILQFTTDIVVIKGLIVGIFYYGH